MITRHDARRACGAAVVVAAVFSVVSAIADQPLAAISGLLLCAGACALFDRTDA